MYTARPGGASEDYAAKANRRNNAESGNHAFKALLGDRLHSRSETA